MTGPRVREITQVQESDFEGIESPCPSRPNGGSDRIDRRHGVPRFAPNLHAPSGDRSSVGGTRGERNRVHNRLIVTEEPTRTQ
ncbi:MAG: hypothetical protein Ct9H300mP1_06550 [Planctomycetaceae bacterium]|nr:MAG: hypothetical protein Ct9H300mP1_06550 [Planctomycetaceae bacterium]